MKTSIYQFPLLTFLFVSATLNLQVDSVQDLKQNLSSTDPSTRASAMQHFVDSLGTVNGQAAMGPAIPILVNSLNDSDIKVRQFAASGLLGIAAVSQRVTFPPVPGMPDITAYAPAQNALLNATSDSDQEVRRSALEAYASTYSFTPELENKVIQEFNMPSETDKAPLLETLFIGHSPSAQTADFLSNLLDDPKWEWQVANRIGVEDVPLTDAVLQKLVDKLLKDPNSVNREACASAIGSYGARAQPYLSQLEAQLANENDEIVKSNLQAAIDKIKDPVHHLSRYAQIQKALADARQSQMALPSANSAPTNVPAPAPDSVQSTTLIVAPSIVANTPTDNGGGIIVPLLIVIGVLAIAFILYRVFIAKKS